MKKQPQKLIVEEVFEGRLPSDDSPYIAGFIAMWKGQDIIVAWGDPISDGTISEGHELYSEMNYEEDEDMERYIDSEIMRRRGDFSFDPVEVYDAEWILLEGVADELEPIWDDIEEDYEDEKVG